MDLLAERNALEASARQWEESWRWGSGREREGGEGEGGKERRVVGGEEKRGGWIVCTEKQT